MFLKKDIYALIALNYALYRFNLLGKLDKHLNYFINQPHESRAKRSR